MPKFYSSKYQGVRFHSKRSELETEPIERRFGVIAIKKGFVSPEQVIKAMEIQVNEDLSIGKHRQIGMILLDQGLISHLQLNEIIQTLDQY